MSVLLEKSVNLVHNTENIRFARERVFRKLGLRNFGGKIPHLSDRMVIGLIVFVSTQEAKSHI